MPLPPSDPRVSVRPLLAAVLPLGSDEEGRSDATALGLIVHEPNDTLMTNLNRYWFKPKFVGSWVCVFVVLENGPQLRVMKGGDSFSRVDRVQARRYHRRSFVRSCVCV